MNFQHPLFMALKYFVSYSHSDGALVKPVVQIMRLGSKDFFFDIDSMEPGENWQNVIQEKIAGAYKFLIFWCIHSYWSGEVRKECNIALTLKKIIVPVLLDDTRLPNDLAAFQWIDFRELSASVHPEEEQRTTILAKEVVADNKTIWQGLLMLIAAPFVFFYDIYRMSLGSLFRWVQGYFTTKGESIDIVSSHYQLIASELRQRLHNLEAKDS